MAIKNHTILAGILFFMLSPCLSANLCAQQLSRPVRELHIGDKIPNLLIKNIINQDKEVEIAKLYKNGLLIINFWATWCSPCIKEIKFLDSLRGANPNHPFNVLSVTYQSISTVQGFLSSKNNQDVTHSNLNIAVKDTLLSKLFPHNFIPHNIWIDSTGTVKRITSGRELTPATILKFYDDEKKNVKVEVKKDNQTFDPFLPFHLADSSFTYRSIISPRVEGINGGMVTNSKGGKTSRYLQWNGTITQFFWAAYSRFNPGIRHNLIEVKTKDSLKFYTPTKTWAYLLKNSPYKDLYEWKKDHTFIYELSLPSKVPDSVFRNYMFNDLERQFNVKASIIQRKIPCIVVTKDLLKPNLPSVPIKDSGLTEIFISGNKLVVKNATISELLRFLSRSYNRNLLPHPYLNEITLDRDKRFSITLTFPASAAESGIPLPMVYGALLPYGIKFTEQTRSYPLLQLTDNS